MWFDFRLMVIIFLGGFFRFFKLDWGEGNFFHPDEYHIAGAVGQLSFPTQMNPEFFSYGSLNVYLIYFTRQILGILNSILIGRFYSALFSTLTIIIVYLISRKLFSHLPARLAIHYSLLAAALCAAMPGLIQQAHFATPESALTFWFFLTLYFWLEYWQSKKSRFLYGAAMSLGLALGTKIVALICSPILVIIPIARLGREFLKKPVRLIEQVVLPLLLLGLTFAIVFPYSLLDWRDFRSTMNYETGVGRGQPVVFYTRQFINTLPVIFQLEKILPYALGPGVLILGLIGALLMFKERQWFLIPLSFSVYFFSQAFLFAKWTRFIAPTFPFFAIFTAYFLSKISKNKALLIISHWSLVINLVWTLMFFSIYLRPDVRITATSWIKENLPSESFILTEQGNMLEVPLQGNFKKSAFDFYNLEGSPGLQGQLPEALVKADYFIVQSRRIFVNHQRFPEQFPITSSFYNLLFSGELGFEKIKEFNSYPSLAINHWSLVIPDEVGEETWSVFDHPVLRIYQKTKPFSKEEYESLLKI